MICLLIRGQVPPKHILDHYGYLTVSKTHMRFTVIISVSIVCSLSGCANPVNRVTSDNYAEDCSAAEQSGRLDIAEEACYRALVNVD